MLFQACFGASPIRSAVDYLPGSLVGPPFAFFAGSMVSMSKRYRPVNWAGWIIAIVAFGLFSTIREDSSVGKWVGYQILGAAGLGILVRWPLLSGPRLKVSPANSSLLQSSRYWPRCPKPALPLLWRYFHSLALYFRCVARSAIQSKLEVSLDMGYHNFEHDSAGTWSGKKRLFYSLTPSQNMLLKKLPPAFTARFPPALEIAYAAIPAIKELDDPLRRDVQRAFAESMAVIWQTMIGISGLGFLFSLLMQELPMGTTVDENYALRDEGVGVGDRM